MGGIHRIASLKIMMDYDTLIIVCVIETSAPAENPLAVATRGDPWTQRPIRGSFVALGVKDRVVFVVIKVPVRILRSSALSAVLLTDDVAIVAGVCGPVWLAASHQSSYALPGGAARLRSRALRSRALLTV